VSARDTNPTDVAHVITGKLHRVRRSHEKEFVEEPPAPVPAPVRRPARVAIALALAHKIQAAIDSGAARDRADIARRLGLTRARVTQMLDLTLLAPDIQAAILDLESVDGIEPLSERRLRAISHAVTWSRQREPWRRLRPFGPGTR